MGKSKVKKQKVQGQTSWRVRSSTVSAYVTRQAGHLAPVTFDRKKRKIQPFEVAPWATEKTPKGLPHLLTSLRGDFFCLPFGGNDTAYRKEQHPPHGQTANDKWSLVGLDEKKDRHTLTLRMNTTVRQGVVDKQITLVDGHDALYCRHIVLNMSGKMSYGHHAIVKFPDEPGAGVYSHSPIKFGRTAPVPAEDPAAGGYSSLKVDQRFTSLSKVPLATGGFTDLTVYPARRGFEDIVTIVNRPTGPFAWNAVTFAKQRYVFFTLKDQAVLPQTVLWISNGGRHYTPWNGRHVNIMGIEDVCSYFHYGLEQSAKPNALSKAGSNTSVTLSARRPLTVNYIMGVAKIPAGFDRVKSIKPAGVRKPGHIKLTADSGKQVIAAVEHEFLQAE